MKDNSDKENGVADAKQRENLKNKLTKKAEDKSLILLDIVKTVIVETGELEEYDFYEFDDNFLEEFFATKAKAVRAWYYGGDKNNYSDPYIKFDGLGNLVTYTTFQMLEELKDDSEYIIQTAVDLADNNSALYNELDLLIGHHGA